MSEAVARPDVTSLYRSDADAAAQREAFRAGDVPTAVYGLGRIGLPLSLVYASTTGEVAGVASDRETARQINDGECPIAHEPRLKSLLRTAVGAEALTATADVSTVAAAASVHVVVSETGVRADDVPDLSTLRTTLRDIARELDPGDLVLVESAVPPGTCQDIVAPILEAGSGLDKGEFGVAACPSRAAPGRALTDLRGSHPKLVGGVDAESTRAAELVYDELRVGEVETVPDSTVAECAKVIESAYRDVNVALANELARLAGELGTDVRRAIEAANTQPHCQVHNPGPGVGGHALPDHPHYLAGECATETPLLSAAREVNEEMPAFTARTLVRELAAVDTHVEDAVVVLFGLSYRRAVADARKSPALGLGETLSRFGATVVGVDPLLEDFSAFDDIYLADLEHVGEMDVDAAVLVTDHDEFSSFDWGTFDDPIVLLDGRDALGDAGVPDSHRVYTIGRGGD
ncbi:UDP-N-acetyl-D-mannosaminuronic acid dehydrogenase [Natronoarchaeum philippinense]|uniref:UDP-N-acetyl-D-mannosamine dehydrogenase n=1 Tax=Natronoarchaeum philippinense TaxID=558529 RepID=A0A285PAQ6_NATPI|nr:nucleotide sugar dehydrogenase [Natronoarchaeum philippinense]SNZ16941.1 UDP-N-acetyl-D-mannosaminuronic acid dehydrogenase [Natronoarchaeum philippinense]